MRRFSRRKQFPRRGGEIKRTDRMARPGTASVAPRISTGVYRLSYAVPLDSDSSGNVFVSFDRSYTQFAEASLLTQLYGEVRLLGFEMKFTATPLAYAGGSGGEAPTQFFTGTRLSADITPPSTSVEVSSLADSKTWNATGRVNAFTYRSMIPQGGYFFTNLADELKTSYAGSPGCVLVANPFATTVSVKLFSVTITGVYEFRTRTFTVELLSRQYGSSIHRGVSRVSGVSGLSVPQNESKERPLPGDSHTLPTLT